MRSSRTSSRSCRSYDVGAYTERVASGPRDSADAGRRSLQDVRHRRTKMSSLFRITRRDDGQDLLEYGLLASLIAIFVLATVRLLANQITGVFWGMIVAKF